MAENTNTQPNVGANPENGAETIPQNNEGKNTTVVTPQTADLKINEGKFTQQDLDNMAAKARGTAERETKRKILAELGLKDDEMDKLSAFKQAYQDSLSEEEKRNQVMEELQADNLKLSQDVEEKDYIIKALIAMTGKNEEDVDKIVKMAKGLKTDENTIEEAINEVLSMVKPEAKSNLEQQPEVNSNVPTGAELTQPSTVVIDTQNNPFKAGQINLTEQGKLIKTNPELAKKLASDAGVKLPNI